MFANMKTYVTKLQAIDKTDGVLKTFFGQNILANNWEEAELICKTHFPYLSVHGELICKKKKKNLKENKFYLN